MDKKRILVVDDMALNLRTMENTLKNLYEVIPVNSGSRAVRYLETEKPDLILLDIRMEKVDGIQTLQVIRTMENGADVPVIMLTSVDDKESVVDCMKLGAYDYVRKPFKTTDLLSRIEAALGKPE